MPDSSSEVGREAGGAAITTLAISSAAPSRREFRTFPRPISAGQSPQQQPAVGHSGPESPCGGVLGNPIPETQAGRDRLEAAVPANGSHGSRVREDVAAQRNATAPADAIVPALLCRGTLAPFGLAERERAEVRSPSADAAVSLSPVRQRLPVALSVGARGVRSVSITVCTHDGSLSGYVNSGGSR